MAKRETSWTWIFTTIVAWILFMIATGFVVKMNWRLFMIGWNLWP